jgi:hypothetical protein
LQRRSPCTDVCRASKSVLPNGSAVLARRGHHDADRQLTAPMLTTGGGSALFVGVRALTAI